MNKFGFVEWDDLEFPKNERNNQPKKGKEEFIRLKQGDNEVRVITNPYQYTMHRYKAPGESGYGQRVLCSAVHGSCPICDMRDPESGKMLFPRKTRWLIGVIDRATNSPKILDMGKSICQDLEKYNNNEKIGNPKNYDINIIVDKNADPAKYYTVQNYGPTALSEDDVQMKQDFDVEVLNRRCTPPDPESVLETVKRIDARANGGKAPAKAKAAPAPKPQPAPAPAAQPAAQADTSSDDDDDFAFPPAQV